MIVRLSFRFQDLAMRCVLEQNPPFHAVSVHSADKKESPCVGSWVPFRGGGGSIYATETGNRAL